MSVGRCWQKNTAKDNSKVRYTPTSCHHVQTLDGKELCKTFRETVKKYKQLKEAGSDDEKNKWPFWAALTNLLEP